MLPPVAKIQPTSPHGREDISADSTNVLRVTLYLILTPQRTLHVTDSPPESGRTVIIFYEAILN